MDSGKPWPAARLADLTEIADVARLQRESGLMDGWAGEGVAILDAIVDELQGAQGPSSCCPMYERFKYGTWPNEPLEPQEPL